MNGGCHTVEFGWEDPPQIVERTNPKSLKHRFWIYLFWVSLVGTLLPPILGLFVATGAMEMGMSVPANHMETHSAAMTDALSLILTSAASSVLISTPCMIVMIISIFFCSRPDRASLRC